MSPFSVPHSARSWITLVIYEANATSHILKFGTREVQFESEGSGGILGKSAILRHRCGFRGTSKQAQDRFKTSDEI